jgi:cyclic pyranopterin phosphate synthase
MTLLPMDNFTHGQRPGITDAFARPLRNLRLSVTDRCNLRCQYCMPEEEYAWLPRADFLTFDEISTLVDVFTALGVEKVGLTGGEPLLRRDVPTLVRLLARNPRLQDLVLTTNGVLLGEQAQDLYDAGLHRITVSLDTLKPERFRALTRHDTHAKVLASIEVVGQIGFTGLKHDIVVMRGVNDDELVDLIEFMVSRLGSRSASPSTWTWEGPRLGRWIRSARGQPYSHDSASTMGPSSQSWRRTRPRGAFSFA